jgi:hypothetical protein
MSTGYGRGYYGADQLARSPRRRGSAWVKIALVVGVGAVIWLVWPRKRAATPLLPTGDGPSPPPPAPPSTESSIPPPPGARHLQADPPPQLAPSPEVPSTIAYEDAVVASAKQLQDAGAKVVLAPHLAHLTPRLGS